MRMIVKTTYGLTETAILPVKRANQIQQTVGVNQTHFADRSGKILLSIDTLDRSVHFADPSVIVEHKMGGYTQYFRGNFVSLIPINVD